VLHPSAQPDSHAVEFAAQALSRDICTLLLSNN
jgi:hypothetical protein